jgi:hypothetical protein
MEDIRFVNCEEVLLDQLIRISEIIKKVGNAKTTTVQTPDDVERSKSIVDVRIVSSALQSTPSGGSIWRTNLFFG